LTGSPIFEPHGFHLVLRFQVALLLKGMKLGKDLSIDKDWYARQNCVQILLLL
jgi:hypothetical protein